MCQGPDIALNDDHRRKIAAGVRRYWSSEDGRARRLERMHAARQVRLAKQSALLAASEAAANR